MNDRIMLALLHRLFQFFLVISKQSMNLAVSFVAAKVMEPGKQAFDFPASAVAPQFAPVLADASGLRAWTREEKEDLVRTIRAKGNRDEMLYLHLMQRHRRLRKALLTLGS
jgi:hypothetical protein